MQGKKDKKHTRLYASIAAILVGVLTGCSMAKTSGVENVAAKVVHTSVHDPSVVKDGEGNYYIFGSHRAMAKSSDLSNWYSIKNNISNDYASLFEVGKKWSQTGVSGYDLSGNTWAPDVVYNKTMQKWCMYMSVNGPDWNSSIALLTSDKVAGPYSYGGTVVYSGFNQTNHPVEMTDYYEVCGEEASVERYLVGENWDATYGTNAIDPTVFYDQEDRLWMVYGSWFGGIFLLELDKESGLRDYSQSYALDLEGTNGTFSDPYLGIRIAGGKGSSGEGPYIEYIDGYYYLVVTYGGLDSNGGYNMRLFRAEEVIGPYTDLMGNFATYTKGMGAANTFGTVGVRLMSNYQWPCMSKAQIAQGHNSLLTDEDGKLFNVYHTRFDDGHYMRDGKKYNHEFHEVRVHQMFMNKEGWPVVAPYEYAGETISEKGYSEKEIVGSYDFLVHKLTQLYNDAATSGGYNYEVPISIELHKDGTVTSASTATGDVAAVGTVEGTWNFEKGTPYMQITYKDVTYNGVFLKQFEESDERKEVMTFTAVGSNNTSVWGSKKNVT